MAPCGSTEGLQHVESFDAFCCYSFAVGCEGQQWVEGDAQDFRVLLQW